MTAHIAVDLGATSGRVSYGLRTHGRLEMVEVARFRNEPISESDVLFWDLTNLYSRSMSGIRRAIGDADERGLAVASIGIDSWGVDFASVRRIDRELGTARHYRSAPESSMERVGAVLPDDVHYAQTGIQQLPINSIYQLSDAVRRGELTPDRTALLIPDLWVYWLTGSMGAELTIASTTGLLDAKTETWSTWAAQLAGISVQSLPSLHSTGSTAGSLTQEKVRQLRAPEPISVIRVAEHDTASAVLALPVEDTSEDFAFISCGSWALAGRELRSPILTEEARIAGFTNEKGAFGSTLFMRNLAGLWLLEECLRDWNTGAPRSLEVVEVVSAAKDVEPLRSYIDVSHPDFLRPGGIDRRIATHCERAGLVVPKTPAEFTRCILESLAIAYRLTIKRAEQLSGRPIDAIYLTGGGSRNELLCQLTADACGRPVHAGPAEGTSIGNVLMQMVSTGAVADLQHARAIVRESFPSRTFDPRDGDRAAWRSAARRVRQSFREREEKVA